MIPLSIIQRFIIYHRKYACRDESASPAELSEYIIYYYDINYISPPNNNGNDDDNAYQQLQQHDNITNENDESTDDSNDNKSDIGSHWYHSSFQQRQETPYAFNGGLDIVTEAIKFAGFCEALEGFAGAFPSSSSSPTECSELEDVQLVDSTLVFVKLEEDPDIIAVAQIDRRDVRLGELIKDTLDVKGGNQRAHGRKARNASLDHVKSMMSNIRGSGNSGPVERRSTSTSIHSIPEEDGVTAEEWRNGLETKKTIPVGGDPRALREALRRCHALFMMLKGGGIAQRMNSNGNKTSSNSTTSMPSSSWDSDMSRLFSLRKQIRKTQIEMENVSIPEPINDINDENNTPPPTPPISLLSYKQSLSSLRSQIISLLPTLPITTLKHDLRSHYDAFFDTLTLRASRWGFNGGRCLVEILAPHADGTREDAASVVSPNNNTRWRGGCRSVPNTRATLVVSRLTTVLLGGRWQRGGLEGIAVFYRGTLLLREAKVIDAERAGILFHYMCSHSPKRDENAGGNETKRGTIASFVKRFHGSITGTSKMEEEECHNTRQRHHSGAHRQREDEDAGSAGSDDAVGVSSDRGYLHPPPLSSTNPLESVDAVTIPPFGSIWMPKVWDGGDGWRVLVYEYTKLGLGFLFYLREDKVLILANQNHTKEKEKVRVGYSSLSFGNADHDEDANDMAHDTNDDETQRRGQNGLIVKTASFFQSLADTISESLDNFCQEDISDPTMIAQPTYKGEPGLDLIYVDRYEHTVTIVPDPQRTNDSSSSHTIKKHFINSKETAGQQQSSLLTALASHLPHGVLLSFDDILTEWHAADDNDGEKEICSFLSGRWVFGRKQADRELFLIFDANKFVTIADVHKAVFRVRKNLLDNTLL